MNWFGKLQGGAQLFARIKSHSQRLFHLQGFQKAFKSITTVSVSQTYRNDEAPSKWDDPKTSETKGKSDICNRQQLITSYTCAGVVLKDPLLTSIYSKHTQVATQHSLPSTPPVPHRHVFLDEGAISKDSRWFLSLSTCLEEEVAAVGFRFPWPYMISRISDFSVWDKRIQRRHTDLKLTASILRLPLIAVMYECQLLVSGSWILSSLRDRKEKFNCFLSFCCKSRMCSNRSNVSLWVISLAHKYSVTLANYVSWLVPLVSVYFYEKKILTLVWSCLKKSKAKLH